MLTLMLKDYTSSLVEDIIDTGRTPFIFEICLAPVKANRGQNRKSFLINQRVVLLILRQITYVDVPTVSLSLVSDQTYLKIP